MPSKVEVLRMQRDNEIRDKMCTTGRFMADGDREITTTTQVKDANILFEIIRRFDQKIDEAFQN